MVLLKKRIPGATAALFERFVRRACGAVNLKGTVNVLITDNSEMRSLNRRFRAKDAPTDVLSFPAVPGLPGKLAGYDHEADNGKMARKEAQLRVGLKLPLALIERAASCPPGAASIRGRRL